MRPIAIVFFFFLNFFPASATEQITPYQYSDLAHLPDYNIPASSRFTAKRLTLNAPEIIYYLSTPEKKSFPILIACGGSTTKDSIVSIIHFHRYFLKEFLERNIAVLTLEQWGVDGKKVDAKEFIQHYTRSQRLEDHQTVINHLRKNPPLGWNGKFLFFGASEGGPLVTSLTTQYSEDSLATINWSGAGDWSWRDELWVFIQNINKQIPWHIKLRSMIPSGLPFAIEFPKTRAQYDKIMDLTLKNPDFDKEFMGMTYLYHADALNYPKVEYTKIQTPFLLVVGGLDTIVESSDAFVRKALDAGAKIDYLKVPDMDHYVRKRPEVVQQTLDWLDDIIL